MAPAHCSTNRDDLTELGRRLLAWYEQQRRELPWRDTHDPYAVWVAEIMLQQTRSEAVIPYYERFLARFPTLRSLAVASLADVLKAWEGLGYYARARNLHAAARQVAQEGDGQIPASLEELLRLPGIGPYTAAAIASIAFGQDSIALDGNLRRVLCRIFAIDDDPGRPSTQRQLTELAHRMLPAGRAGDLNQALMDLGAGVCLPAHPRCLICPLMNLCQSQFEGIQEALPIRATRSQRPHRDVTAGVIWNREGQFLITRRPLDAMLGGLWEFPGGKRRPGEELAACLRREITEELEIEIDIGRLLCTIDHGYTHFHMTLFAFECRWLAGTPQCLGCTDWHWVTLADLNSFAFPVADQKIIAFLRDGLPLGTPND
jgi:A/G-specific adenine glycosylase